MRLAIKNNRDL